MSYPGHSDGVYALGALLALTSCFWSVELMTKMFFGVIAACALWAAPAFARPCNNQLTLSAIDRTGSLIAAIGENPNLCRLPLGSWGYDSPLALASAIKGYYQIRGCNIDQNFLIQNLELGTPICHVQWFVRFL